MLKVAQVAQGAEQVHRIAVDEGNIADAVIDGVAVALAEIAVVDVYSAEQTAAAVAVAVLLVAFAVAVVEVGAVDADE